MPTQNYFLKESLTHAWLFRHGMLKNALTYEIMKPEDVGVRQTNLVLGKHSGRHALANRMAEIGYNLTEAELDVLFVKFKDLADKKKHISDWDLEALVSSDIRQLNPYYQLDGLQISCGTIGNWGFFLI